MKMKNDDPKRDRLAGLVELNHNEVEQVEGGSFAGSAFSGARSEFKKALGMIAESINRSNSVTGRLIR